MEPGITIIHLTYDEKFPSIQRQSYHSIKTLSSFRPCNPTQKSSSARAIPPPPFMESASRVRCGVVGGGHDRHDDDDDDDVDGPNFVSVPAAAVIRRRDAKVEIRQT